MRKDSTPEPREAAPGQEPWEISRRTFLRAGALAGLGLAQSGYSRWPWAGGTKGIRFGVVTDLHYADAPNAGSRHYRESLAKLGECVERMKGENVDFLIELGDFKDQDRPPVEERTLDYLRDIEAVFARFDGRRYHVLGNHDVDSISKEQFCRNVKNSGIPSDRTFYSFDRRGVHFVVLDANFASDGTPYDSGDFDWTDANVSPAELEWLRADLAKSKRPTIVFTHQLLDGEGAVYVENAADVRAVLEQSGRVLGVFQGHHHAGDLNRIEGIPYYTLKALVEGSGEENNSYAIVEVDTDYNLTITGYRKAVSQDFTPLGMA